MDRNQLISKVKIKMDELSPFDDGDISPAPLIDEVLDEAAKKIQLELPLHLLAAEDFAPVAVPSGTVTLPTDFLRLASFQMACWERPVVKAISKEDPLYALQKNVFVRGGVAKPVVAIYHNGTNKVLEYYSVPAGTTHTVGHALYIKDQAAQELDDSLADALTWKCAAMVYEIMEMYEQAAMATNKYNEYLIVNKY